MSRVLTAATLLTTCVLSGCFTGERPTLAESPTTTGDAIVDGMLATLDAADDVAFTATYDVLTRFGDLTTAASVTQDGTGRRSVTIGSVRFLYEVDSAATCDLTAGTCSDTIDAARISDTQLAPDFYATSAVARLRRDAAARVGAASPSTTTLAGQQATCVQIPVNGGPTTYCVVDGGPLASLDAADVRIDLTSFSPTPDESLLQRPG